MSKLKVVAGQHSHHLRSRNVDVYVTKLNGNVGPITFNGDWSPMHLAPWAEQPPKDIPNMLKTLRGDFFCLPFGGNGKPYRGETYGPHGETANREWSLVEASDDSLRMQMKFKARPGTVDKQVSLIDDHPVVYQRHTLTGFSGPMCPGHHAMLKCKSTGIISTSAFEFGQVFPEPFENPTQGGYSCLKPGAKFDSLKQVPMLDGSTFDASAYPANRGFDNLFMLVGSGKASLGWSAITFPQERYVWFALKDPRVLHHTVMWFSNRGRHYHPWNSRHTDVLGIEDVTAYFAYGLAESAYANPTSRAGYPTVLNLSPKSPMTINYIFGAAKIPAGFDRVEKIEPDSQGVTLIAKNGKRSKAKVNLDYLYAGS